MPGLDVLRGIAILSVLVYHGFYWSASYRLFPQVWVQRFVYLTVFGWLGVNLFFVLSGFLITGILLDTRQNITYFRPFYIRRILRIVPAYLFCIAILLVLGKMHGSGLAICLFYLTNLMTLHPFVGYGVFWSLSVEEQFYAVWPAIVRFLPIRAFFPFCISLVVVCPVLRLFSFSHANVLGDVHMATLLIADNFAGGAILAYGLRTWLWRPMHAAIMAGILVLVGLTTIAVGYRFGILHRDTATGAAMQTTPFLLIFCGMVLFALIPSIAGWLAKRRVLQFFGYISYGLYLYHLLFFDLYDWLVSRSLMPAVNGRFLILVLRFILSVVLAIGFSWLSRRYFEAYFLRVRSRPKASSPAAS
ncbi:MAG TPA: acyltransferase [Acidobacteriaceae bacterium]|nr:acyltransferase [Acidobacteriaceae bacterium]